MAARKKCGIASRNFRAQLKGIYRDDLYNLICNTVGVKNAPADVPERWIKELLLVNGEFAIWKNMVLEIAGGNGLFVYGEPTALLLRSPNRETTWEIPRNQIAWIGANQKRTGVLAFLDTQVDKLVELEVSLLQNIIASRSGDILGVKDPDLRLSIEHAILQNEIGTPFIVLLKNLIDSDNLTQIKLSTEFMGDRINQLKQEIYNETLAHYGILNANSNKRERVQVGEIEAQGDFAYDSIYTIIETANRDADAAGESIRFYFNGALDDFTPNRESESEDTEEGEEWKTE